MTLSSFDEEHLMKVLGSLTWQQQLMFGAVCCERLLPNYLAFQMVFPERANIEPVRCALDSVWAVLQGENIPLTTIQQLNDECEAVAPDSDEFPSNYTTTLAQDACFSVCCLLDFIRTADVERMTQVARYAIDSVDLYVGFIENIHRTTPETEQKILSHPLMQRELRQQKTDIEVVQQAVFLDGASINQLRHSWNNDGKSNLDLP